MGAPQILFLFWPLRPKKDVFKLYRESQMSYFLSTNSHLTPEVSNNSVTTLKCSMSDLKLETF